MKNLFVCSLQQPAVGGGAGKGGSIVVRDIVHSLYMITKSLSMLIYIHRYRFMLLRASAQSIIYKTSTKTQRPLAQLKEPKMGVYHNDCTAHYM